LFFLYIVALYLVVAVVDVVVVLIWVDMLTEVGRKLDRADVEVVALVIVFNLLLVVLLKLLLLLLLFLLLF
jgi:hypothetical protein